MTTRRAFILGAASFLAAPAIVRASSLMSLRKPMYARSWGITYVPVVRPLAGPLLVDFDVEELKARITEIVLPPLMTFGRAMYAVDGKSGAVVALREHPSL